MDKGKIKLKLWGCRNTFMSLRSSIPLIKGSKDSHMGGKRGTRDDKDKCIGCLGSTQHMFRFKTKF
jgi:hypothetical protein